MFCATPLHSTVKEIVYLTVGDAAATKSVYLTVVDITVMKTVYLTVVDVTVAKTVYSTVVDVTVAKTVYSTVDCPKLNGTNGHGTKVWWLIWFNA